MSSVRDNIYEPLYNKMPLIKVDSELLISLINKSKQLTKDLELLLHQSTDIESKPILICKPIDMLKDIQNEIENHNEDFDPYPYIIRLSDALGVYATGNEKIGNDFKHLFETLFIRLCKKLRSIDFAGTEGLNTIFLSTVCKVRDIKWLLQLISCFSSYYYNTLQDGLFCFTKKHLEEYSKIGSRDCQILMNKLIPSEKGNYDWQPSYILYTEEAVAKCDVTSIEKWFSRGASFTPSGRQCKCYSSVDCLKSNCDNYKFGVRTEKLWLFDSFVNNTNVDIDKKCDCIKWLLTNKEGYLYIDINTKNDKLALIQFLETELIPKEMALFKKLVNVLEIPMDYLKSKEYFNEN